MITEDLRLYVARILRDHGGAGFRVPGTGIWATGVETPDWRPIGTAAAGPPEADPAQDGAEAEEDRHLVPLECPVVAGGLIGQWLTYPELVDAALNEGVGPQHG